MFAIYHKPVMGVTSIVLIDPIHTEEKGHYRTWISGSGNQGSHVRILPTTGTESETFEWHRSSERCTIASFEEGGRGCELTDAGGH